MQRADQAFLEDAFRSSEMLRETFACSYAKSEYQTKLGVLVVSNLRLGLDTLYWYLDGWEDVLAALLVNLQSGVQDGVKASP